MIAKKEFVQCVHCGKIHQKTIRCDDNDLYIYAQCPTCGRQKHLRCGDDELDVYLYYDIVLDTRYYEYNTKQND